MLSDFHWQAAGHCKALEALTIRGGAWRVSTFPSKFAYFRHPRHGWCLFDTGYAPRFLLATERFPYKFYELTTPVSISPAETARAQLAQAGIKPEEVETVVLSHLHADHVAGLLDFPRATIVTSREGWEAFQNLKGLAAVRKGYLPQLIPTDFERRAQWVRGDEDLWGDGSLQLVPLPGHAAGQVGAILQTDQGPVFLCADACWHSTSYRQN